MNPELKEALLQEAERVRASGELGEAGVRRLFDYLVANSLEGHSPKEIAIAIDVFGRGADFDVSQDALVRVYIHKLRRALRDIYRGQEHSHGMTLQIPRGEYRLTVNPQAAAAPVRPAPMAPDPMAAAPMDAPPLAPMSPPSAPPVLLPAQTPQHRSVPLRVVASALLAAAAVFALCVFLLRPAPTALDQVRSSPLWSWLLHDERPTMVIVGDYYLVGETDQSMEITRLIREYAINSKSDLDQYVKQHPEVADKYVDVGLGYLPTSTAFALRDIVPLLTVGNRRVMVNLMSDVKPSTLKAVNIVYIGYMSGLGLLQNLLLANSRFAIGDSYDELVDKKTGHHYISQTASQNMGETKSSSGESPYRDYGFFSAFKGPDGNNVIIIAGTRDEGVRQTAEAFTNATKLRELDHNGDLAMPYEALLEVTALDGVNLSGRVLLSSKRDYPNGHPVN